VEAEDKPDKVDDNAPSGGGGGAVAKTPAAVEADVSAAWKDILVIPRKPFLKDKRVELVPFTGVSINNILIQHYTFGFDLNFFLTDVFSVGVQGQYFIKNLTEREQLVGLQYNRIPTLNRYLYGGALNFGYVPVYGKFALFNSKIISWEIFASAGFGITRTEIIARNPSNAEFGTNALTPNIAIGGRIFLNNWLTFNWSVRDYIIVDKFEKADRPAGENAATAKANATSALAHNAMFMLGVGLYLPTSFQYKQPR
jgi:outer membrane beta-barrel protein